MNSLTRCYILLLNAKEVKYMAKASQAQLEANARWRARNKEFNDYKRSLREVHKWINPDPKKAPAVYKAVNSTDDRIDYIGDLKDTKRAIDRRLKELE